MGSDTGFLKLLEKKMYVLFIDFYYFWLCWIRGMSTPGAKLVGPRHLKRRSGEHTG